MERAEAVLARNAKDDPALADEAQCALAGALERRRAGDEDSALVYLLRGLKFASDRSDLLTAFATEADVLHLYLDGREAARCALELQPENAEALYALGRLDLDRGDVEAGERSFRQVIAPLPTTPVRTSRWGGCSWRSFG